MGSDPAKDKDALGDERPQHRVYVPEFHISRYPVTNAQYAVFVRVTGLEPQGHWKNVQGRNVQIPIGKENHPVNFVSWHDAIFFCEWLSRETGKFFRLPTEAEWEKAARGTDGRIYPWGDESATSELCSFGLTVGDTTSVGRYSPRGDSPYGCADMAGNVWEWTQSLYRSYPYDPDDGREDVRVRGNRVLRGGAFEDEIRHIRCASRLRKGPSSRDRFTGFRCVFPASDSES
ncbi:MAG: SUMF1/EgtB/PvdO family nonheme iron enzyme [Anaerolineae bacterium]|nr:SUMF1/EgtB/PvdO family nonheme iron enzyme [Anaerolineae bacterium]